jgi:glycosyltransferase involved in cell wall biosynthesis
MSPSSSQAPVEVSVIVSTCDRATVLREALAALVAQVEAPPYEVVVVDNNSTDDTPRVIEQFAASGLVRGVREPRQGLSYARNRGIAVTRAGILAFTDDDVRVAPTWIRDVARAFRDHPDVSLVGGKVLPEWAAAPPPWLDARFHAPLALVDYGDVALRIPPAAPRCLIGANLAIRRRALAPHDGFSPHLQRVRDGIGSTEDHDLQMRMLQAGAVALYDPRIVARAPVPRERLAKRYHRAWHQGHGRFYARMRDPQFERTRAGSILGVPAHVYRSVLAETAAWAASAVRGRRAAAFAHELRLRFLAAFTVERISHRP